jgi:hypothetical protein
MDVHAGCLRVHASLLPLCPCLLVFTGARSCLLPSHWWVSMPACCFYKGGCSFEHFCCLLVRCRSLLYLLRWVSMPPASSLPGGCPYLLPHHWWMSNPACCFLKSGCPVLLPPGPMSILAAFTKMGIHACCFQVPSSLLPPHRRMSMADASADVGVHSSRLHRGGCPYLLPLGK